MGNSSTQHYLLVEFEDGSSDSVFKTRKSKSTPEWAPRFESAYSQIVDWLWKLEDMRTTSHFEHAFGSKHATFQGLIVIGKDRRLQPQEQNRLRWRMDKTLIDSNAVSCVSFDQLRDDMARPFLRGLISWFVQQLRSQRRRGWKLAGGAFVIFVDFKSGDRRVMAPEEQAEAEVHARTATNASADHAKSRHPRDQIIRRSGGPLRMRPPCHLDRHPAFASRGRR